MLTHQTTQSTRVVLAAAGDTWGISGPTFLVILLVLAGAALLTGLVSRRVLRDAPRRQSLADWDRDPHAVAMLNGGPRLAVTAALSALHVCGLITAHGRTVTRVGEPRAGRVPLERAILDSTSVPTSRRTLAKRKAVRGALEAIRADLVARGLLLSEDARRRMRRWGYPMLAVLALAFTRVVAGIAGGRPVGYLWLLFFVLIPVTYVLLNVPARSALGDRELAWLRHAYHQRPLTAGMGVAVFGASALWASDPAFAGEVVGRSFGAGFTIGGGCGGGGCGGGGGGCGGGGCGG